MNCVGCEVLTTKYKCSMCNYYCCSLECYKTHKSYSCIKTEIKTENFNETHQQNRETVLFPTDDTLCNKQLEKLDKSNTLKDLLSNKHLRDFIMEIDGAQNAWKAMKGAMLEPLFIEFADECLKIVEPNK